MPENLRHGAWVQFTLSIIAYDHNEYPKTINLWADRLGNLEQKPLKKVPRKSLFAHESAQRLGSPKPGDIGPAPARDSRVPRQPSDYFGREARERIERAVDSEQPAREV
jgi:hypothetical protein